MKLPKRFSLTGLLGSGAAVVGTSMMSPQVLQALETHKMADVSFAMAILYVVNCMLWLLYGLRIKAKPVVYANIIGLAIGIAQVVLKIEFG